MSFRGRGRGRGRFGGGGFRPGKQVSSELFPEIEDLGTAKGVVEREKLSVQEQKEKKEKEEKKKERELKLAKYYVKLETYWRAAPYYIEDRSDISKKSQSTEVGRFSGKIMAKTKLKTPLSHLIKMEPEYVPGELARVGKKVRHGTVQVQWNQESDFKKLDLFEKLEQKYQGQDRSDKQEDEEDEEEDEQDEEEEVGYSTDDDYAKNIDFDDDDDGVDLADGNDDEPMY